MFLQNMTLKNDYSSRESKEFSTKQLAQMIRYCEDYSTCRRQLQLGYLGETDFDPADCRGTCDNCARGSRYTEFECLEEGVALVQFMKRIEEGQVRLSKNQLIGVIRGKPDKNVGYRLTQMEREMSLQQLQEKFAGWRAEELDNFILEFICHDIFCEQVVQNNIRRGNMNNNVLSIYLKCNAARCNMFLSKVQSLPFKREVRGGPLPIEDKVNDYSFLDDEEI